MADLNDVWGDEGFDDIAPSSGTPEPVPPDDYTLHLDSQELKPTKDQTGVLLSCVFQIIEGQYEGRRVFTNFNVKNKNAQAQQIGIADFKAFCMACGVDFADARADTSVLLQIPFRAKIGMSKPKDGYESRNEIKKYYPADGAAPAAAPAPAAKPAARAPAAAAGGQRAAPSWMNKRAS